MQLILIYPGRGSYSRYPLSFAMQHFMLLSKLPSTTMFSSQPFTSYWCTKKITFLYFWQCFHNKCLISEHLFISIDCMAYTRQSNILTNPFSYERIMVQRTHHIYKVIKMCRDNNFSHFCQIIFLNSLQAPNKKRALFQSPAEQTPCISSIATFAFLLLIPQIMEQMRNHLKSTMKHLAPAQVLNPSYIHRELPNLFSKYVSQAPTSNSMCIFQDGGLTLCSIIDLSSLIPLTSASS